MPGLVPDLVIHRHQPLPEDRDRIDMADVQSAATWVRKHWMKNRSVLIRSDGGTQRPGLVAAVTILHLGGTITDALDTVPYRLHPTYVDALHTYYGRT